MHGLFNEVFVLLGMVLFVGLYAGKMARRVRLPSLIGFMLLGVVLGPSALKWFGGENLEQLSFLTEMALGFVAFAIGAELSMKSLRKQGWGIVSIILAESFAAFFLVFGAVALLTRNIPLSLLFGALAPASAPAGTVAVIQEYKARGSLTQALYAVVGFDDGLAILIFGFAAALAKLLLLKELGVSGMPSGFWGTVQTPLVEIVGSLAVGLVLGLLFSALIRRMNAPKDLLILSVAVVFVGTGLANHFHLSLILTNMVIGFVLVNTRSQEHVRRVQSPMANLMPLLFLLFFTLAGAHLDVRVLSQLGLVGLVYILARSAGKIAGARAGAQIGRVEEKIRKYVGLGILSQAGVAIGLSLIISHDFAMLVKEPHVAQALASYAASHGGSAGLYDPANIAVALVTTVTATCIVFELVGPVLAKYALRKAGEIPGQD